MNSTLTEKYRDSLKRIPEPGAGCHPYLLTVANLGALAGIEPATICDDIRQAIPRGRRWVSDREIFEAVEKAARDNADGRRIDLSTYRSIGPRDSWTAVDGGRLFDAIAAEATDPAELWELSPIRLTGGPADDGIALLENLYRPDEILFLGDRYDKEVKPAADWVRLLRDGATFPHIMPNPLTGEAAETKSGGQSYRCDAAVSAFRFAVIEFDDRSKDDQSRFWAGIVARRLLDVAAVIDSGGKSLHGWIRTGCENLDDWDRRVRGELFDRWMVPAGCDRACSNPGRLSRLPGHRRAGGNIQSLRYLKPTNKKSAAEIGP